MNTTYIKKSDILKWYIYKILLIMRLTMVIFMVCIVKVSACTLAQEFNHVPKGAAQLRIVDKIKTQTEYNIMCNEKKIDITTMINADSKKPTTHDVLNTRLSNLRHSHLSKNIMERIKKEPLYGKKMINYFNFIEVRGKVVGEKNRPLEGAVVKVKGSSNSTPTNSNGEFVLRNVNENAVLVISFVGYVTQEVKVAKNIVFIKLLPSTDRLDEVEVNAGYYTVTDRERTGSISRVTAETIGKQPINNPLQAIQGRIPGVEVVQQSGLPGGGFNVRIRGQNSIANGNDPLYIVNGVPVASATLSSNLVSEEVMLDPSPLSSINPSDIESIEVLKDADATAIYGSRGANGVILITTKKGKVGNTEVAANFYQGVGMVTSKIDLLNTQQYIEMRNEAFKNDELTPTESAYDVNGTWDQTRYTDWQEVLIGGSANTSNAQISLSGGSKNTRFLLSNSYYRETNVYPGKDRYQRKSFFLNLNHISSNQKFKSQFSAGYNIEDNTLPRRDLTSGILIPPNAPSPQTSSGELNWENGSFTDNPLAWLRRKYKINSGTLTASSNLSYHILPRLEFIARIGYTKMQRDEMLVFPLTSQYSSVGLTANNRATIYVDNWNQTYNIEPQLSYTTNIRASKISFLIGSTIQGNSLHMQTLRGTGYASDGIMENIFAATSITPTEASNSTYRYLSVYSRLNYIYSEKYIINLTGRRDGSSRFGTENIYANFGAIGCAWIFSEEKYISDRLPFLSFGKLRGSFGISGNDQIGDYNYLELWQPTNTYQGEASLNPTRLFNPNFAWEVNKKAEISLELRFFKDRLNLTNSFFKNRSSNQLIQYALSPSTGFSFMNANLPATVQNSGWEFELNFTPFILKGFRWSTFLNLSLPKNTLVAFPNLDKSSYSQTYIVGESLNIIKTIQSTGVDPITGLYTYFDADGNGLVNSNDARNFKTLGQKYSGGIQNIITWKNFDLDFLLQFVNQTGRNLIASIGTSPGGMKNQSIRVLNRWREVGDVTNVQKFGVSSTSNPYAFGRVFGDSNIDNASFIRLKNVSVAYRFPSKILNPVGLRSAKCYLQAQNLLTFTNYFGLDPESQRGVSNLPPLTVITAGFEIIF